MSIGRRETWYQNTHFDVCHCKLVGGSFGCFLWTSLLVLWVDIENNFTINFYINCLQNYYNLPNYISYIYGSCLAHHLMSWPDISNDSFKHKQRSSLVLSRERSLWIFFFMTYAWLRDLMYKKGLDLLFCMYMFYFSFWFSLMASCLHIWLSQAIYLANYWSYLASPIAVDVIRPHYGPYLIPCKH